MGCLENKAGSVADYIEKIRKSRKRCIDLSLYRNEIIQMQQAGLTGKDIAGWFRENNLSVSTSRMYQYLKNISSQPAIANSTAQAKTSITQKASGLPSLYDDID